MAVSNILSFPKRGPYGRSSYRGNCSGYVQKHMLDLIRPSLWVDPMAGSRTSLDVNSELRREGRDITCVCLDLNSGFNILREAVAAHLPRPADYAFLHPPYYKQIIYSGFVYGEAHPDDLSRSESYEDFLSKLQIAVHNTYDALRGRRLLQRPCRRVPRARGDLQS